MCAKFDIIFLFCILGSIQLHQQIIHKHIHAGGYYPWTYNMGSVLRDEIEHTATVDFGIQ
jgi:hypothetical protein